MWVQAPVPEVRGGQKTERALVWAVVAAAAHRRRLRPPWIPVSWPQCSSAAYRLIGRYYRLRLSPALSSRASFSPARCFSFACRRCCWPGRAAASPASAPPPFAPAPVPGARAFAPGASSGRRRAARPWSQCSAAVAAAPCCRRPCARPENSVPNKCTNKKSI